MLQFSMISATLVKVKDGQIDILRVIFTMQSARIIQYQLTQKSK